MLKFFRRYQKFFFIVITTATICSFIFFGTYQAFAPIKGGIPDEVVFQTVDGKKIKKSYLSQFCYFLSHEPTAPSRRGALGNFLNDGILSKDFFESGLAVPLYRAYRQEISAELEEKLTREKNYVPYTHPYARFLSATAVWGLFAPDINDQLAHLKTSLNASTDKAFETRIALYLAERRFPPTLLAQVLRYQEKDNPTLPADPRLFREELSLFGYKSAQDWFGASFIECAAEFILNSAAFAKQKGYIVTIDEAKMDLLTHTEKTYQALREMPSFPAHSAQELFQYYLKGSQIDEGTLVKLWQDVMLFRRLFQDVGGAPLLDTHTLKSFFSQAKEYATIELYQMPPELRFQNEEELKIFEKYITLVCPERTTSIEIPEQFEPLEIVEKRAPELVGRRYTIELGTLSKKSLEAKVTVKETWDWESAEKNWEKLQKQFPVLASRSGEDEAARSKILEALDKKTRMLVDEYARSQIVDSHPEWIEEGLAQAEISEKEIFLKMRQKKAILEGISDPAAFMGCLDREDKLSFYTQDQKTFYRFAVKARAKEKEIVSFKDAKKEGLLDSKDQDCLSLAKALYKQALEQGLIEKGIADEKLVDRMAPFRFAFYLKQKEEESGFWKPIKKQETLSRSGNSFISFDQVCALQPEVFSTLCVDPKEGAYYYRLLDKKVDTTVPVDKVIKAQEVLSSKAKVHFMDELVKLIQEKQAIVFSKQASEE